MIPAYTIGRTGDGIAVMTVNAGNEGIKSFAISIVSEQAHSGSETAVFVHLRNGAQITMDTFEDDYETVNTVSAEFNVQAGDVVKAYIVDEMRKATNFKPFVLQ